MILKLLLIIGVIAGVYFAFFKKKNLSNNSTNLNANDMVQCEQCDVYSELKDSILSNGKYYCSKECLEKES